MKLLDIRVEQRRERIEQAGSGYDNAHVHSSLFVRDFRTKNAMTDVRPPPHSADLALINPENSKIPENKKAYEKEKIWRLTIKNKSLEGPKSVPKEDVQKGPLGSAECIATQGNGFAIFLPLKTNVCKKILGTFWSALVCGRVMDFARTVVVRGIMQ